MPTFSKIRKNFDFGHFRRTFNFLEIRNFYRNLLGKKFESCPKVYAEGNFSFKITSFLHKKYRFLAAKIVSLRKNGKFSIKTQFRLKITFPRKG